MILAGIGEQGGVNLFPTTGGAPTKLPGFDGNVWTVAVSRDGRLAAAGGGQFEPSETVVKVWETASGELVHVLGEPKVDPSGEPLMISDVEFLPDGRLVEAGWTGLRLWDLGDGSHDLLWEEPVMRVAVDPEGRKLLFVEWFHANRLEGGVILYDLAASSSRKLTSHGDSVRDVAFDPSGTVAVTGDSAGVVRVGPISDEPPHLLLGHEGRLFRVSVSPDGRWLATACPEDGSIRLWPMPQGQPLHALPHSELLARLRSLTNVRIVADPTSTTGYREDIDGFPGWQKTPSW
jgi:WD40 repeat protein